MEIISVTRGDHPSAPWRLSPSIKGMIPLRPAGLDRHEGEKLVGGYSTVGNITIEIDLLLSVINVSVQTVDIVNNLPKLKFD